MEDEKLIRDRFNSTEIPRRQCLAMLGGALAVSLLGCDTQHEHSPLPALDLGSAKNFPEGRTVLDILRLILIREQNGFGAMSLVCTHQPCLVAATPKGFSCPCHGSQFSLDGTRLEGPAEKSLPWFELALSPEGNLLLYREREVASTWRLQLPAV